MSGGQTAGNWLANRRQDIVLALGLLTRLPLPVLDIRKGVAVGDYVWAFPLAGLVIGLMGAIPLVALRGLGLNANLAALAAVTVTVLASGALHEDGLADFWDGLGGGRTRARKLEIMRDSSIGSYGAVALMLVLATRWSALAAIADPADAAAGLILTQTAARAMLALVFEFWQPARKDGLAAGAGSNFSASAAAVLGAAAVAFGLARPEMALATLLAAAVAVLAIAGLAGRYLGGYTGDVLGAAEQTAEALGLVAIATVLAR